MKRLIASILISLSFSAFNPVFASDDIKVEEVIDFSRLGDESRDKRLPILLMFSAEHCSYCIRLEEDFLKPMLRSGDYEDKILIRKLKIDDFTAIRDFKGESVTPGEFAERYRVYVTPTVVFLDGEGSQLAKKRVGLSTPEFYGGYLDQSIDTALDVLRRNKPLRVKLSALED